MFRLLPLPLFSSSQSIAARDCSGENPLCCKLQKRYDARIRRFQSKFWLLIRLNGAPERKPSD